MLQILNVGILCKRFFIYWKTRHVLIHVFDLRARLWQFTEHIIYECNRWTTVAVYQKYSLRISWFRIKIEKTLTKSNTNIDVWKINLTLEHYNKFYSGMSFCLYFLCLFIFPDYLTSRKNLITSLLIKTNNIYSHTYGNK